MNGHIEEIEIAGLSCSLYLPADYESSTKRYPAVYINGEASAEEILAQLKKTGFRQEFLMLSIKPENWNDDFTPWEAPAFRQGEQAPKGGADAYIKKLTAEIKPYMDTHYRTKTAPEHSLLLGYSLGGLAALYTFCRADDFAGIGCLSGSLWYDGFVEFMGKQNLTEKDGTVYLSLGKKEGKSRNKRMGQVADCTERIQRILEKELGKEKIVFEWNEGGHFHEIPKRFAKAIVRLLEPMGEGAETGKENGYEKRKIGAS